MSTKEMYDAVKRGDLESICKMIKKNLSLKDEPYADWTPLQWAAKHGRLNIVRYLVEHGGVDKDKADGDGSTPLYWAASNGHLDVVRYLAGQAKADKDKSDRIGWTPLIIAAFYGHLDVVRYLLDEGADDTLKDVFGKTALALAEKNDYTEVADALREYQPGGLMFQRSDAVDVAILDAGLGPDVAQFCGDFVLNRKRRI